jgi:nitrite reductase/ring-hydroxylating ferredoxin subunit
MSDEHACDQSCQLARREFLGAAALAALALLEAACGNGQIGPVGLDANVGGSTSTAGLVVTLASFAALANTGGIARVDGGSRALRCPHQGFTVSVQGGAFYCQAHGARFSSTGVNNGGQRTSNLVSLKVSYDALAGTVTIG